MPQVPGGLGSQLFGIGIFVPTQTVITLAPGITPIWPKVLQPPRANYGWVQSTNMALSTVFMPGAASSFYDFRPVRFQYSGVSSSNMALLVPPVIESVPARAVWPESLQPPRLNYGWTVQPQLAQPVEAPPVGEQVQNLVRWPDYPLNLRSRMQGLSAGQFPVSMPGAASSFYDFRTVRFRYSDVLGSVALLTPPTEVPPPVSGYWPKILRYRIDYGWVQSSNVPLLTFVAPVEAVPARAIWLDLVQPIRVDYSKVQSSNFALLSVVVEQPPVGAAAQALVRWIEYPRGLRTQIRSQQLEEGMPVGETVQQRLRDPEYLRSLRSWSGAKIFEEAMPPRSGDWPRITRPRGSYNWVQATSSALIAVAAPLPPKSNTWPLVRPYPRATYNWVQASNIALLTTPIPQIPPGKATFRRTPEPDLWRLRSFSSSQGATAPIIPPFVPPPPPPSGRYRALADVYLPDGRYIEAGEIFTGTPGWIPAVGVDPIDANAIQAYWDAGPATMQNAEDDIALGPWGLWDRRVGRILPANVYWRAVGDGTFILTGDGAPLGPHE